MSDVPSLIAAAAASGVKPLSTNGLVSHAHLITKVYFPREILPLTYVFAALFDFLIASTVLIALLLYYRAPLTANLIYVLPMMAILTLFAFGDATVTAAKANGGIHQVAAVEHSSFNVLGIYSTWCTIVRGN